VGLGASQSRGPRVVPRQRVDQGLHLAQLAAQVGVGLVEVLAVGRVLLGHRLHRGDRQQVDRHRRLDGVPGADRLHEVVSGVEEDHVDARRDLAGEVRQHGVTHRGGDAESLAERRHRPFDDVLGGRELELGAHVGHHLAQLLAGASVGVGAAEVARLVGGGGRHEGAPGT
jgi:hypothetical protein